MKRILLAAGLVIILIITAAVLYFRDYFRKFDGMEIIRFDPQMTLFIGGGGNSILLTSKDGSKALIVDTKMGEGAKKLRDAVKAGNIILVNTHNHPDHISGNSLYPNAEIVAGAYSKEQWNGRYPDTLLRQGEEKIIKMDGETVHIRNMGRAHSWNDLAVYFEKRKLIAAGDAIVIKMHPVLIPEGGASISNWTAILDTLNKDYDIKTLVPGHGSVSDKTAVLDMKDYFESIGTAVENPEKLKILKNKYKDYIAFPVFANFDRTMEIIKKEKK